MTPRRRNQIAIILSALVGVATPLIAHAVGGRCWIFLPAHVPTLFAGLTFGTPAGLATGAATALADLIWGGRVQGSAFLPIGLEFLAYGVAAGAFGRSARRFRGRVVALCLAMLVGRLVYIAAALALGRELGAIVRGLFLAPWPGILIQLTILPAVSNWIARRVAPQGAIEPATLAA